MSATINSLTFSDYDMQSTWQPFHPDCGRTLLHDSSYDNQNNGLNHHTYLSPRNCRHEMNFHDSVNLWHVSENLFLFP